MPGKEINDLTLKTTPVSTDELELQETSGGTSKKTTVGGLTSVIANTGKNAIINGDFNIWQRGTSFAAIPNAGFSADRFLYGVIGTAVHTASRSTDVPTQAQSGIKSNYSLLLDCTTADTSIAAGDYCFITQYIEGYNYKQFEGNTGTLSFWVKGTKTGIHCVAFRNTAVDRSYVVEYTINTTATWEKKTITVDFDYSGGTWDYTTGVGLRIAFVLSAGSDRHGVADTWNSANDIATTNQVNACDSVANDFRLAQVQFELGGVATPFESRFAQHEIDLCHRYYQRFLHKADISDPAHSTVSGAGAIGDAGGVDIFLPLRVNMRVQPTTTLSAYTGFSFYDGTTNQTVTSIGASTHGTSAINIYAAGGPASGFRGCAMYADAGESVYIAADAEL